MVKQNIGHYLSSLRLPLRHFAGFFLIVPSPSPQLSHVTNVSLTPEP